MTEETKFARLAGVGYAVIFALALHANLGLLGPAPATDDPEGLLRFVREQAGTVRLATAELLVVTGADVYVAWALYRLIAPAASALNALSTLFRLTYTVAQFVVILHLPAAVQLATAPADDPALQSVLVAQEVARYHLGFTLTLVFFGVHLLLLGLLIARTRPLPTAIGALVALAGLAYVGHGLGTLLAPEFFLANESVVMLAMFVPALAGEGLLLLWLLFGPIQAVRSATESQRNAGSIA